MKTLSLTLAAVIGLTACSTAIASNEWKTLGTSAGTVFIDTAGMSLYTFREDAPGVSTCNEGCVGAWPPFLADADAQERGAWTIITRADGSSQWALNDQPLYYWVGDQTPGDMTGDGVGGVWDLARPAVAAPREENGNGGGGYSY